MSDIRCPRCEVIIGKQERTTARSELVVRVVYRNRINIEIREGTIHCTRCGEHVSIQGGVA